MVTTQILVVEDENIVAKDLQSRLQRLGYAVPAVVASGEEAIQAAADLRPDLVLMDIVLKGEMDGIQAATEIFKQFGTPVVFLTAYGDEDYVQRARDIQPLGYILKPFKERELHAVIQAGLYRWQIELRLKESEEKYRQIVETAQEGIWLINAEGNTSFVNNKMAELLGYAVEEMLGAAQGIFLVDNARVTLDGSTEYQQTRAARQSEFKLRRKDGSELWTIISTSPILDAAGKHAGILAMVTNITERKLAEEQVRRARDELENRVQARTTDLAKANVALQALVAERERAEEKLKQSSEKLQMWVAELEQRNSEMTWLNEMGDLLQSCRTATELYDVVAKFAQRLFPNMSGGINIINASRNYVEAVTAWGSFPPQEQVFFPIDCWALRRGHVHSVNHTRPDPACHHINYTSPTNYMCIPLAAQGEALGALHLRMNLSAGDETPADPAKISASQERLAVAMGEHIALALSNLGLRESLRHQAIHDPLTGLFNRRYMEETLERELLRAVRRKMPVGVIMFDLDHFKIFNDTYGHAAGDRVLHQVGAFLMKHARAEDLACRYGGEEFIVVLPETNADVTFRRAEELRVGIKDLKIRYLGQLLSGIAVSLGVAVFPTNGSTVADLVRSADIALYRAKREGRDRVMLAVPFNPSQD